MVKNKLSILVWAILIFCAVRLNAQNTGAAYENGTTFTPGHCLQAGTPTGNIFPIVDAGSACLGGISFPQTVSGTTTSGGIPYLSSGTVLSSSGLLTQFGVVLGGGAGGAPTSTAAGVAGTLLTGNGAAAPTFIDFPQVEDIPSANCNNTTAGAGWSIGSGGTVTCRAGTNNLGGFIAITDTATTFAQFSVAIPEDWDSGTNPYIRFQIASTDVTSGHTIIPQIKVSCAKGDGTTTDDVTFNAAHSASTITLNTTANQFWSNSSVQLNATDVTGCVAGGMMIVQVGRATDTATNAEFYRATMTFPRKIVVQAN